MLREITHASLEKRNSFGIEATARRIVEFDDTASLRSYLLSRKGSARTQRMTVLGGGNNILFTGDFEGTLLHPLDDSFSIAEQTPESVLVRAGAGMDWDTFVGRCISLGLWGTENLSAIPGTVGAAPVQNIGAYGAEAKDIIESVEAFDLTTMKETAIAGGHCGFGYRDSVFKRLLYGRTVITAVNFRLSKAPHPNLSYGALASEVERVGGASLENIRQAVINIRNAKLPDPTVLGNAGSFFKNPVIASAAAQSIQRKYPDMPSYPESDSGNVKIPAGWLIENAGWKGRRRGRAGVYHRQALILVNHGGATGREIAELAEEIISAVESMFGIRMETEVNIW